MKGKRTRITLDLNEVAYEKLCKTVQAKDQTIAEYLRNLLRLGNFVEESLKSNPGAQIAVVKGGKIITEIVVLG